MWPSMLIVVLCMMVQPSMSTHIKVEASVGAGMILSYKVLRHEKCTKSGIEEFTV